MQRSHAFGVLCVASGIVIAGLAGAVGAQSVRPAATLDDLLAETRSLRTDVNRVLGAVVRAQVLATRLSVQEQRVRAVGDRIDETQRALAGASSERRARVAHLNRLQELRRDASVPPAQLGDVDEMLTRLGQEVAQATSEEQAFRDAEQELRRTLSAEQNLWGDFNSRLEELERSVLAGHQP